MTEATHDQAGAEGRTRARGGALGRGPRRLADALAGSAGRSLDHRTRLRLLRGLRTGAPRDLSRGLPLRAGRETPAPDGALRVRAPRRRLRRRAGLRRAP